MRKQPPSWPAPRDLAGRCPRRDSTAARRTDETVTGGSPDPLTLKPRAAGTARPDPKADYNSTQEIANAAKSNTVPF